MKTQWKRHASQASLLALMVTMAFGAVGGASAADSGTETKSDVVVSSTQPVMAKAAFQLHQGTTSLLLQPAHQRNYLKLLASTYAPETLTEWKQALEERKQVESEMPKPTFSKKILIKGNDASLKTDELTVPTGSEDKMYRIQLSSPAVPDGEKSEPQLFPGKELRIQKFSKEGVKIEDSTQALPLEGIVAGDIIKTEPSESFKRQQKLADAVEADDSATIKSLLPELLKDYKNETETLRNMTKKLKEQSTDESK